MTAYRWGTTTSLALDEIDVGFRRYRLQERDAEQAMAQSLRRYPPWSCHALLVDQACAAAGTEYSTADRRGQVPGPWHAGKL